MLVRWTLRVVACVALLGLCAGRVAAQYTLRGQVVDAKKRVGLPFVNVGYGREGRGVVADINGYFSITTSQPLDSIVVSYIGYAVERVAVGPRRYEGLFTVRLHPIEYDISAVYVSPGVNPAHRIIRAAIAAKEQHDPANLPRYSLRAYSQMAAYITADWPLPDSSEFRQLYDSAMGGSLLFFTETASQRTHVRGRQPVERVLSTRTSGLQRTELYLLSASLQSLSFYDAEIHVIGRTFQNPLSPRGFARYSFRLEDTLIAGAGDTVYTVSFRPRRAEEMSGFAGVLQIASGSWALVTVRATVPKGADQPFAVTMQQRYEQQRSRHWFPVELRTDLAMDSPNRVRVAATTRLSHFQLDSVRAERTPAGATMVVDAPTPHERDSLLALYRYRPLRTIESNTYRLVDSLGREVGLDNFIENAKSVFSGYIPLWYVQIPITSLVGWNVTEGFRLGVQVESSPRLCAHAKVGGYYAYGFSDKRHKWGGFLELYPLKRYAARVGLRYRHDVVPPGDMPPLETGWRADVRRMWNMLYLPQMDYVTSYSLDYSMLLPWQLQLQIAGEYRQVDNSSGWGYPSTDGLGWRVPGAGRYELLLPSILVSYSPLERRRLLPTGMRTSSYTPVRVAAKVTYGMRGFSHKEHFTKVDLEARGAFKSSGWGSLAVRIGGGAIVGDYPLSQAFSNWGALPTYVRYSDFTHFITVRPWTFFQDYYADLHLLYDSSPALTLRILKNWRPSLVFALNGGWGWQQNPVRTPQGETWPAMGSGLYEVGAGVSGVLPTLGIVPLRPQVLVMYRLGEHMAPRWQENLGVALFLTITL